MFDINPYNPWKVLCHYDRWCRIHEWTYLMSANKKSQSQYLQAPVTVSVDLANKCNMKCIDCNADWLLKKNKQTMLSKSYLGKLADVLSKWDGGSVKGVCLGGGGDSTLNPNLGYFVKKLVDNKIGVGMVSNGLLLHKFPELQMLKWLGISIDAGTSVTWAKVHGMKNGDLFYKVLDNMQSLIEKGIDITYKYLIRPENLGDIYSAIKKAVSIGCKNFHIRPEARPWFNDPDKQLFTENDVEFVNAQLSNAKKDYSEQINIVGVFNKLGENWKVEHPFNKCWAIFASCVFLSNKKVGLCCDLRGCPTVEVGPYNDPMDFLKFWGSREHFDIQKEINLDKCSRCTFSIFNKLFEQIVIEDRLMIDFI